MTFIKNASSLPQPSLVDVIITDHRATVALLDLFSEAAKAEDKQMMQKLQDAITLEIRLHSQAEMDVLYPLMAKKMKNGKEMEAHVMEEHQKIEKDLLEALKLRKEGGEKLTSLMEDAKKVFLEHMKEEEDELLPVFLEELTAEETLELANQILESKQKAPLMPQVLDAETPEV
ncbi:hypothetical protein N2152v2_006111 [Parachlorella kessleri]